MNKYLQKIAETVFHAPDDPSNRRAIEAARRAYAKSYAKSHTDFNEMTSGLGLGALVGTSVGAGIGALEAKKEHNAKPLLHSIFKGTVDGGGMGEIAGLSYDYGKRKHLEDQVYQQLKRRNTNS